jgi:hypothetical protein
MKQCIAQAPNDGYYKTQLKRFESGERNSEPADPHGFAPVLPADGGDADGP